MRRKLLGVVMFGVLFSQSLFAAQPKDSSEKTIPFAVYEQRNPAVQALAPFAAVGQNGIPEQLMKLKEINTSELSKFIKNIRETVCPVAREADVRMWVSADANAKLYILGAGVQSGFEVNLHCK